jgi:hypothetical protein
MPGKGVKRFVVVVVRVDWPEFHVIPPVLKP